jgi:hypothetical protein
MSNQTLIYIGIAAVAWYFLMGPGKQPQVTVVSQSTPQTSAVTGAGAANVGGCPSSLSQDQCSKYLSERIGLERDKAWAGVAGQGIAAGSGLLKGLFS